eukprot:tig00020660_g12531.t1
MPAFVPASPFAVRSSSLKGLGLLRRTPFTVLVLPSTRRQAARQQQRTFVSASSDASSSSSEAARAENAGKKIVVLGGGFGGLYTALRLSQYPFATRAKPDITLVDQNDRFIFLPFLYELITGEVEAWEVAPRFEALLGSSRSDRPRFVQGRVESIDVAARRVRLANSELEYDRLVVALGSVGKAESILGASNALTFKSLADAELLMGRLRDIEASPERGAGKAEVLLVERGGSVMKQSTDYVREKALQALSKRGVRVLTNVSVNSIDLDSVSITSNTGDRETIRSSCVVLTAGTQVSPVVQGLPFPKNERGQLVASDTLQPADRALLFSLPQVCPEIFALGDCATVDGRELPATAQAAIQAADYCAWNVWASCTGRQYLPFRFQNLGEMVGLGVNDATFSSPLLPFGIPGLSGPAASILRRLVYLYRLPSPVHQLDVARSWLAKGAGVAAETLAALRKERKP